MWIEIYGNFSRTKIKDSATAGASLNPKSSEIHRSASSVIQSKGRNADEPDYTDFQLNLSPFLAFGVQTQKSAKSLHPHKSVMQTTSTRADRFLFDYIKSLRD